MSQAPYALPQARTGYRYGNAEIVDIMVHDGLWDPYENQHMGMCAEVCAAENAIGREQPCSEHVSIRDRLRTLLAA